MNLTHFLLRTGGTSNTVFLVSDCADFSGGGRGRGGDAVITYSCQNVDFKHSVF